MYLLTSILHILDWIHYEINYAFYGTPSFLVSKLHTHTHTRVILLLFLKVMTLLHHLLYDILASMQYTGLPLWLSHKESIYKARETGSIPGLGRFPGEGNGYPLQHSCHGQRTLTGYSLWGHVTERLTLTN